MVIKSFDIEADDLLEDATKIHCIGVKQMYRKKVEMYSGGDLNNAIISLSEADAIVCHNLWGYDLPLLDKLMGVPFGYKMFNNKSMVIIDSLAWSRKLYPDRPLPRGCPNKVKTSSGIKQISPHGLDAWAYRVSGKKPEVTDWKEQELQVYIDRCREDVLVTEKAFIELCKEGDVGL